MHTNRSLLRIACRAAACSILAAGAATLTQAQQASSEARAPQLVAAAETPLNLSVPADLLSASSSSSSSSATALAAEDRFAMDASQPPPRRRYGRPNYADSHTNPDGSNKFAFMAGVGASIPTQDTANYLTTSYAFQVGAGRNFSKMFGIMAQFDYDHFGFQGKTLQNQQNLYNSFLPAGDTVDVLSGLDGSSHVWSFTLDPTVTFYGTDKSGAYFVGGVGFYHKTANFTVPATGTYCDPYYGCYQYSANETIDKYTSNAVGFNGGLGLTYRPSRFSGERFYVEARYVYVDNQPRAASNTNLYPPNANQTYYVPVTFGLRF